MKTTATKIRTANRPKMSPHDSHRALARFKRILRRHLPELQARYGVRSLGVFGSYVRGEAKQASDLDVLVEFGQDKLALPQFCSGPGPITVPAQADAAATPPLLLHLRPASVY